MLAFVASLLFMTVPPQTPHDGKQSLAARATGAALQADARTALGLLTTDSPTLTVDEAAFRDCLHDRFLGPATGAGGAPRSDDPVVQAVLQAYHAYWREVLMDGSRAAAAEDALVGALGEILGSTYGSMDALEPVLKARLEAAGVHSLHGRTGPLRELMIWESQTEETRRVALPEGDQAVRVVLLDEFLSLGWANHATCGRRGAGGWATPEALYAVVPRYQSLDGEEFRVTFLGHEAQHFADLRLFPGLESWRLEYRAKLVELAQVEDTRERVLRKFTEDQSDDPSHPHGYANRRILAAMTTRLGIRSTGALPTVETGSLQGAARAELAADTARLRADRTP